MKKLILFSLALGLMLTGCAKRPVSVLMTLPEFDFGMKLPPGWKQGKPLLSAGNKYEPQTDGRYCYESEKQDYPFGIVRELALMGATLEDYVHAPAGLHGAAIGENPRQTGGFKAIEIVGRGLGENQVPIQGIYLYVQRGDKVLLISLIARQSDFGRRNDQFRTALNTIEFERSAR